MKDADKSLSKFLSLVLRHKPQIIHLTLDANGWAQVDELLAKLNLHHRPLTLERLRKIVETNDKKRFVFSEDQQKIRASQGHSIVVDLQLREAEPPPLLFHGTALKNINAIETEGLLKRQRHHVHLAADWQTAKSVGSRYGQPVVIGVRGKEMYQDGFMFFQADNGVWLTEGVPSAYLDFNLPKDRS